MKNERAGKIFLIIMFGVFPMLLPCIGDTAIPSTINYQGYVISAAGVPVNGTVQMVFKIYDVASGGTELWSETQNVAVNQGVYSVNLGNVTPIGLPFNQPYYLGVKVGIDSEMTPRIALTSVGYAFRARTAEISGLGVYDGSGLFLGYLVRQYDNSVAAATSHLVYNPDIPAILSVGISASQPPFLAAPLNIYGSIFYFTSNNCSGQAYFTWVDFASKTQYLLSESDTPPTVYRIVDMQAPIRRMFEMKSQMAVSGGACQPWSSAQIDYVFPVKQVSVPLLGQTLQPPIVFKPVY